MMLYSDHDQLETMESHAQRIIIASAVATTGLSMVEILHKYAWLVTLAICVLSFIAQIIFKYLDHKLKLEAHKREMRKELREKLDLDKQ